MPVPTLTEAEAVACPALPAGPGGASAGTFGTLPSPRLPHPPPHPLLPDKAAPPTGKSEPTFQFLQTPGAASTPPCEGCPRRPRPPGRSPAFPVRSPVPALQAAPVLQLPPYGPLPALPVTRLTTRSLVSIHKEFPLQTCSVASASPLGRRDSALRGNRSLGCSSDTCKPTLPSQEGGKHPGGRGEAWTVTAAITVVSNVRSEECTVIGRRVSEGRRTAMNTTLRGAKGTAGLASSASQGSPLPVSPVLRLHRP